MRIFPLNSDKIYTFLVRWNVTPLNECQSDEFSCMEVIDWFLDCLSTILNLITENFN